MNQGSMFDMLALEKREGYLIKELKQAEKRA
jgi:hypothetical protein